MERRPGQFLRSSSVSTHSTPVPAGPAVSVVSAGRVIVSGGLFPADEPVGKDQDLAVFEDVHAVVHAAPAAGAQPHVLGIIQ